MNNKELVLELNKVIKKEISKLSDVEITITDTERRDCVRVRVDYNNEGKIDYCSDLFFFDDYTQEEFIDEFIRYIKRETK